MDCVNPTNLTSTITQCPRTYGLGWYLSTAEKCFTSAAVSVKNSEIVNPLHQHVIGAATGPIAQLVRAPDS